MSIASIDNDIRYYRNQIDETNNFISNLTTLKNNSVKVMDKLLSASEDLKQGFTLDGTAIDNGILEQYSTTLRSSISSLDGAISTANSNLGAFSSRIDTLLAERKKLLEMRKKNERYKI